MRSRAQYRPQPPLDDTHNPTLSPPPPSTTPSHHHHHQRPPLPPTVTCPTQQPQHAPTSHKEDDNAMSPLKNATMPHMNEPTTGATSPTATWQPDDERQCLLLLVVVYIQLSDPPSPPTSSDTNLGANVVHNARSTPTSVTHRPQRPCNTPRTTQERHFTQRTSPSRLPHRLLVTRNITLYIFHLVLFPILLIMGMEM